MQLMIALPSGAAANRTRYEHRKLFALVRHGSLQARSGRLDVQMDV
ncbi:MAG TPA: hypothetical protein VMU19_10955 [Bryobacteraceae bacterium]|nr:hypothetical protein [Bryobacteraceae bacterium]